MALEVARRGKFEKVAIAFVVLCQQDQGIKGFRTTGRAILLETGTGRNPDLAAQQRFQAMGKGALVERNGPKKVPLIGQGRRRHLEFLEPGHEGLDADRAFQKRELTVKVEMDKTGFHADIL